MPEHQSVDSIRQSIGASPSTRTSTVTRQPPAMDGGLDMSQGNAAAQTALQGGSTSASTATPTWSKDEIKAVQRELTRLGLYKMTVDGDLGRGSKAGLVEAFGSDSWRTMSAADAVSRLSKATPPPDAGGVRYGEMFKDHVLDITLGIGYDETGAHLAQLAAIKQALNARGYAIDAADGALLLGTAGRKGGGGGQLYVKRNALRFKPPAGDAYDVHAVVRLVSSADGSKGEEAAAGFKDGMQNSDVSMYGGHGRYGSGPDFDRNFSFDLMDKGGEITQTIPDYHQLEAVLKAEGQPKGKSAWTVFKERVAAGTLKVNGSNGGNVGMNQENLHPGEFGSNLMYWNVNQGGGKGSAPVTGKDGAIGKTDKNYRLWLFDGCRTQDYNKSIRATPGADSRDLGVMASTKTLYWSDIATTLAAFLDGVVAAQSGATLTRGLDDKQSEKESSFKFN